MKNYACGHGILDRYITCPTCLQQDLDNAKLQIREKDDWIKALETRLDTMTGMMAKAGLVQLREPGKPKCEVMIGELPRMIKCGMDIPCPDHE